MFKIFHLSLRFCFFISLGLVLFCTLAQFSPWHLSNLFKTFNFNTRVYKWSYLCEFIRTGFSAKCISSLSASKKSKVFLVCSIWPRKCLYPIPVAVWLGMSPSSLPQMGTWTEIWSQKGMWWMNRTWSDCFPGLKAAEHGPCSALRWLQKCFSSRTYWFLWGSEAALWHSWCGLGHRMLLLLSPSPTPPNWPYRSLQNLLQFPKRSVSGIQRNFWLCRSDQGGQ